MSIKITIPNSSSDVLTFGSGNTPTAAQIAGIDSGSSNGQLALYTTASGTSTERVRINASGNVGIGTSSPGYRLDVRGGNARIAANASGASDGVLYFGNTATNYIFGGDGNNYMTFGVNNAERMRIDSSGNVGIGTSSPVSPSGFAKVVQVSDASSSTVVVGGGGVTAEFGCASGGGWLSATGANPFRFATNGTERARIDSSGNLLVGTTSTVGAGVVSVAYSAATSIGLGIKQTNSGAGTLVNFYNSAGTSQGYIYNNNNGTVSYANGSDYRLKSDIAALSGGLAQVMQLKPCTYKYIGHEQTVSGFIAHELAEVCPQAVVGEKDAVDTEGNPVYQGVDTSFLVATLTAAIQEQQAIITSLTDRVSALDERLTALENK